MTRTGMCRGDAEPILAETKEPLGNLEGGAWCKSGGGRLSLDRLPPSDLGGAICTTGGWFESGGTVAENIADCGKKKREEKE